MSPERTVEFVDAVRGKLPGPSRVESIITAPAVDLYVLKKAAGSSSLHTGAESAYFEIKGTLTGETSPKVLNEMGIDCYIIGHSECRGHLHRTGEDVNKEARALFASGITPAICCGESLRTREANKQGEWVITQIKVTLDGLTTEQVSELVITYGPIWTIGTGKTASADRAERMYETICGTVKNLCNGETAESVRIQYGGSVRPANAEELVSKSDIDGGLVGSTSLDPESFLALVNYQD